MPSGPLLPLRSSASPTSCAECTLIKPRPALPHPKSCCTIALVGNRQTLCKIFQGRISRRVPYRGGELALVKCDMFLIVESESQQPGLILFHTCAVSLVLASVRLYFREPKSSRRELKHVCKHRIRSIAASTVWRSFVREHSNPTFLALCLLVGG